PIYLHVAVPTADGVTEVQHLGTGVVDFAELAVLQQPADVHRRPALGVRVLHPHEAQEPSREIQAVTVDVIDPATSPLALDLPPDGAARIFHARGVVGIDLRAGGVGTAARAPGAVAHADAVDFDLL